MDDWHQRYLYAQIVGQAHMFSGGTSISVWNIIVDDYVADNSMS